MQELNFKEVLDNYPNPYIIAEMIQDTQGNPHDLKFLYINNAFSQLIKTESKDIIGKTTRELHINLSSENIAKFAEIANSKSSIIFKDFCPFSLVYSKINIFATASNLINIIIENTLENPETIETHLQDQKNKDTEMLFNIFMDTIPLVVWIRDYSGIHLYMNRSWEKYLKLNRDDCLGKTVYEIVDKDLADKLTKIDEEVIAKGKTVESLNDSGLVGGIHHYWNSINFPFVSATGQKCIGSIAIEMTKQKKIEDELKACKLELEKLKKA